MMARSALVLSVLLVLPVALANHTPPGNDSVDGGKMWCERDHGGVATSQTLPLLRTTDNGHLKISAVGTGSKERPCEFAVKIVGYSLPGGVNPQGGLNNVASTPCLAGGSCTATAEADWWVTFVDPINGIFTPEIDVHFVLLVNGNPVASGDVRLVEPSVPRVSLP